MKLSLPNIALPNIALALPKFSIPRFQIRMLSPLLPGVSLLPWALTTIFAVATSILFWDLLTDKKNTPVHKQQHPIATWPDWARQWITPEPKQPDLFHEKREPRKSLSLPKSTSKKSTSKKRTATSAPADTGGDSIGPYRILAGRFLIQMGAEVLIKRLEEAELPARMESNMERVVLNNVQAGPFENFTHAKEAEIKLHAGGFQSVAEESWDGYIISLGLFHLLGHAMEAMEKVKNLGVQPVRLVKIETAKAVQSVVLGPFENHEIAKEISRKIAGLGLAVPVIQPIEKTE